MNIFYLDNDPETAARYHGDQHVVKMVLESAQLLSTAHHVLNPDGVSSARLYRPTHQNHPCSVWARSHAGNYLWLFALFTELCAEFGFRRGKVHRTSRLAEDLSAPPDTIAGYAAGSIPLPHVPPPTVMPDEFIRDDCISSYRAYYVLKWQSGAVKYNWGRPPPNWLTTRIKAAQGTPL